MALTPGQVLPLLVALPFVLAAIALMSGRYAGGRTGFLMILGAASCFLGCLDLAATAWTEPAQVAWDWIPALGVAFALRADPFGLMYALLISGIGTLVGVYSIGYMPRLASRRAAQYYATLLAFMGAMLGVALADDLVVLFLFWEITSLTSFLLIGFWYEQEEAAKGAMTALQITALGGMVMMVGIVLIGTTCGTFRLSSLIQDPSVRAALIASPAFAPALLLLLAGALTKSAQWPFHFWLPGAMVAPTPISTYLHAATMVKAGVFLMGRIMPIFSGSSLWSAVLVPIGLVTMLLGAFEAVRATDLKAILARTTVATLGFFTLSYGLGTNEQDALQIFSHATYKGALFLVAGIIEHATHTRDIRSISGLRARMPITFAICLVAAFSMAGLWPSLGFHAKEANYASIAALEGGLKWLVLLSAGLGNALLVCVALILVSLFFGPLTSSTDEAHDPSPALWLPAAVLSGSTLVAGLFAPATARLASAFSSNPHAHVHLALAVDAQELVLAALTLGGGVALYAVRRRLAAPLPVVSMQSVWDGMIDLVTRGATSFSGAWQNGSVYWYFSGTLIFTVGLSAYAMASHGISLRSVTIHLEEMQWYGVALCVMLAASGIMVVSFGTRVAAAIALTANGFLTALLFVVYRSPDILLTQILIETVSTIFILLILYFMPAFKPDGFSTMRRVFTLALSVAVGTAMFAFVMLSTSPQFRETKNLAIDYLSRSLADAGGANAVNVIIVDFRAMDTNGEITVLMMVALLVYGLLRTRRSASAEPDMGSRTAGDAERGLYAAMRSRAAAAHLGGASPILHTVAQFAVPLTAWVSFVIFMQGHNLPGGGFIAGVMGAAAGAMYMLAYGIERAARVTWWRVAVVGLIASVTTGAVPFLRGHAYMDHEILHFVLPLIGPYELPTATFFDLGVYMIVLGTIMTIFVELGQEAN